MSDDPLPPGWSKHWSNTWKKHYWFHAKSGKQSWDPPSASDIAACENATPATTGSKRGPDEKTDDRDSKQQKAEPAKSKELASPTTSQTSVDSSQESASPQKKRAASGSEGADKLKDKKDASDKSPQVVGFFCVVLVNINSLLKSRHHPNRLQSKALVVDSWGRC